MDDGLDRDLEALLNVEPSPAFVARVRARVAEEQPARGWFDWRLVGAGLSAAALALVVVASVRDDATAPASTGVPDQQLPAAAAGLQNNATSARRAGPVDPPSPRPASTREAGLQDKTRPTSVRRAGPVDPPPAVLIDAEAARAFHQFALGLEAGAFDVAVPAAPSSDMEELDEITIQPVVIEPLVTAATRLEEGDLQ